MKPSAKLPQQKWMTAKATKAVVDAFRAGGVEVRFVGGCVRDAVAGRPVKDIDMATPADPETVMRLLGEARIKVVPTGIAHGTVTAVSRHKPHEITTLRKDVKTFGRHAEVAFTDDWVADAARRDLTINAMSCSPEGELYDPFDGRADLATGHIRFVGDARTRIEEDYLRLLRFFRFHAYYGGDDVDAEALAAAKALAPNLVKLSGERLREELLRLLAAPDPIPMISVMVEESILPVILPEAVATDRLAALIDLEPLADGNRHSRDALRRLAALIEHRPGGAVLIAERFRLSRAQAGRLAKLTEPHPEITAGTDGRSLRLALYAEGGESVRDLLLLDAAARQAAGEGLPHDALKSALKLVAAWKPRDFPLRGRDAQALGLSPGPDVGRLLREVESWWLDQDLAPSRADCLAELKRRVAANRDAAADGA
jgi:poly(A) polymerase